MQCSAAILLWNFDHLLFLPKEKRVENKEKRRCYLENIKVTRRCTTVRDSEGQAIPCIGGSDGSLWVMGKWSMRWVSG